MATASGLRRVEENQTIESDVSARLDRLPWSRWHTRIIIALGTSWLLDGLEVTLVGSLSGILESKNGLSLTDPQVTAAATTYLAGAVLGAILFGYLTDRLGRKKLFLVTLATYSIATVAGAFSWNLLSFSIFRFFTGLGIGGEYSAINSAVDELIPGKVRGTVDLVVIPNRGRIQDGVIVDREDRIQISINGLANEHATTLAGARSKLSTGETKT